MGIYGNLNQLQLGTHSIFESSRIKATISGKIWDVLMVSESGSGDNITRTPINVDDGVAVKIGAFTNNGNGLQERFGTIAGVKDHVAVLGTPALVKDARTKYEENETFFYNKAGNDSKAYEIIGDEQNGDIYGISLNLFTDATQTLAQSRGSYVVLDGNGKYVAQAAKPTMSNYGFVGQVHSVYTNNDYTLVRIYVIQNVDNNT